MKKPDNHHITPRVEPYQNRIPLSFEKAIEGLLAVKPKKTAKRKKKPGKK